MKIADDRGYERVAFESDNRHVAHAVLSGCIYENDLGIIVSSCRSYLSKHASFIQAFIRRQANRVTHNFVRASVFHSSSSIL